MPEQLDGGAVNEGAVHLCHVSAFDCERRRRVLLAGFLDVAHVQTVEDRQDAAGSESTLKPGSEVFLPEFRLQAHVWVLTRQPPKLHVLSELLRVRDGLPVLT